MSDTYIPSFFSDDPRGGALTYEQLQARRKIATALATRNRGFPKNIGEGLTYFGEALGEALGDRRAAADEAAYRKQSDATVQRLSQPEAPVPAPAAPAPQAAPNLGPLSPDIDPVGNAPQAQLPAERLAPGGALATAQPLTAEQAAQQPSMSIEEWMQRIARNESGGRKDAYTLVGERSRRGDYPYGKYQVMGENIGPWTQAYLGKRMTPQEFLADPDAQDKLTRARGGEYMTKYGPNGAAAAWFAGEKGMNDPKRKDTLGTHVAEYGRRFNIPLVSRDQMLASVARSPGGVPPSDETMPPGATPATGGAREDIAKVLLAQQSPMQPLPTPQRQPAPPMPQQQVAQQLPVGRPVPTATTPQAGPLQPPQPTPMSPREMEIRRAIGATTDPRVIGQLTPIAEQMEAQRKFEDSRKIKQWELEATNRQKLADPLHQAQVEKLQQEQAAKARELQDSQRRGGISQEAVIKGVETSAKTATPLREASIAVNQIEDLLNKGMFTGLSGRAELVLAKAKMAVGGAVDPRVAATEQFESSIKPIVAAARAALAGGANISDRDMQAAEKAAGGDITLTEAGIRSIMSSLRVVQMQTAMHHQKLLSTAAGGDTNAERTLNSLYGLPMENIIPKDHPTVQRLMQNADNEHERGLFNQAYSTPGLAERIIARNRTPR